MKKRLYDIGWSNEQKCRGCNKEEGMEKQKNVSLSGLEGSEKPDPRRLGQQGTKGQHFKERLEVAQRKHGVPSVTVRRWESEKYNSCGMSAENCRPIHFPYGQFGHLGWVMERTKFKRMSIDRVFGKEVGLECDACQGASRRKVTKAITPRKLYGRQ